MRHQHKNSGKLQAPTAAELRQRVLIVDDEADVRKGFSIWLSQRGFSAVSAPDIASALDAVLASQPDVILLDVRLGPEDGLELVSRMRELRLHVPCVVFTAHAGPYDGFKAHELGVVKLIEKPSTPDKVAAALREVIELQGPNHLRNVLSKVGHRDGTVAEAVRLIQARFHTKSLSLAEVAKEMGISLRQLGRVFRSEIGFSVVSAIHRCRIAHAAHLLKATTLSVKAIADDCGYHGSSELHRHFTRQMGESPKRYRVRTRPIDNYLTP